MQTQHYGIFGELEFTRDDNGYIIVPVIIQASGLYAGSPPHGMQNSLYGRSR
jgi:hypothetical protein